MNTIKKSLRLQDITIFFILAVLAGCGLVYQYLLSHYAGRVLGAIETVIYTMIGIMIVSMGLGAFAARYIKCAYTGFAWLELGIALLGSSAILAIAAIFAFTHTLPQLIAFTFGLPPDLTPQGGVIQSLMEFAAVVPYIFGFILGVMIGIEIPLIARVRQSIYGEHLEHNLGDIYGIDYIGAGVGAALWVIFMLAMEPSLAAALTASANIGVGLIFYFLYRQRIKWNELLLLGHILVASIIVTVGMYGAQWDAIMEDTLYKDKVAYHINTHYQRIVITERTMDPAKPSVLTLYLNGRTQFSSNDEHIYHSMLTYPALAASARQDSILIIGGGDGLALRDVLRWQPKQVTLIDLDKAIVDFFSQSKALEGDEVNTRLLELNQKSFSDPRVTLLFGDAYNKVDELLQAEQIFDTIIIDLPDPNHPDLNKLYSARFYAKLKQLLAGDGAMAIQSTSPYHAKDAFLSVGVTMQHAGFEHVEQYHHNVPSFGEWGWTIATKLGRSPRQRLAALQALPLDDGWMTKGKLMAAFEFSQHFFKDRDKIRVNRVGSGVAYQYYRKNWEIQQGIYQKEDDFESNEAIPEPSGDISVYRNK
ncbi:MAG: polyamine aminopropyltransferase [Gammaproteobacteria bacterium]|nr:polyamine aminopropyltransferase [Gammaproteobacteria bacterium]